MKDCLIKNYSDTFFYFIENIEISIYISEKANKTNFSTQLIVNTRIILYSKEPYLIKYQFIICNV